MLETVIASRLHQRHAGAPSNFPATLPPNESDLAQEITGDPYVVDLIRLQPGYRERELQAALLAELCRLLLDGPSCSPTTGDGSCAKRAWIPRPLDLLGVLRRSGPPYRLTTRELTARSLVSAGAISQRLARVESAGLTERTSSDDHRRAVAVTLTEHSHQVIEATVDQVLTREASLLDGMDTANRQIPG